MGKHPSGREGPLSEGRELKKSPLSVAWGQYPDIIPPVSGFLFEIYIQQSKLEMSLWAALIRRIYHHLGLFFGDFTIEVLIKEARVRFFVRCARDLTRLSSELYPFMVKRVDGGLKDLEREADSSVPWLRLGQDENIISLRDRQEFKKGRTLYRASLHFSRVFVFKFCTACFYFSAANGLILRSVKLLGEIAPLRLLGINFNRSLHFKKRSVPLFLKLEKTAHLFEKLPEKAFLEVLGFPYLPCNEYFPLSAFEFNKHSLIVGQTGTGKSKLIELFVQQVIREGKADDYSIVVLDPHASLYQDFVTESINIDFLRTACSLFSTAGDANISTELTLLLFKTVVRDQFNPKMERVLKYSLYVLYSTGEVSLLALRKFLTELEYRKSVLAKLPPASEVVQDFFATDFIELQTKYYELSIMPVLVLLDELSFLPSSSFQENRALRDCLNDNHLTFLSLNKIMLGEKATKLLAGLLIQQVFLLAQSRSFKRKVIFIIDEVSVVENDALSAILSEARKFDLSLFLTQQYLTQINPDLLKSVLTNAYNYFVFKVSEDDARLLGRNLDMEFGRETLEEGKEKGQGEEDLKVKMITTLNPRECLARVYSDGRFHPCFKARTMDVN